MPRLPTFSGALLITVLSACGGGGGASDPGPGPDPIAKFSVSGRITAASGIAVDSDVNDPNAPYAPNDTPTTAQPMPNPVTLGGYVNVAGAGEAGRSKASGDKYDAFKISALSGQQVSLSVDDPAHGDPDLYLYDATGSTILASSVGSGTYEQVAIPQNGQYIVLVQAASGASDYVLTVGKAGPASLGFGALSSDLEFVPGEAIVKLKDMAGGDASKSLAAVSATHAFTMVAGAPEREMLVTLQSAAVSEHVDKAFLPAEASEWNPQFATAELRQKWETMMAIKALRRDPRTQYAEPNYIARPGAVPNDQYYPLQWHYPAINLPAAWDITRGSASVIVAVVDTGVRLDHPDLQGQLVDGFDFVKDPVAAHDGDGIDPDPTDPGDGKPNTFFHGTHVAGTIAAASNNKLGVAGVAPGVKIMPVRVLAPGTAGGTRYDILQGVRYAAGLPNDSGRVPAQRADIINLSLGAPGSSQAEQDVYMAARARGAIIVASAMNDNTATPAYPASYNGVISVSAATLSQTRASYSNFGPTIKVAAPGGDAGDVDGDGNQDEVLSTCAQDDHGTITFNYCFAAGTSMAAPHVSGVIALMKSVNPTGITPDSLDQLLASGKLTDDIGAPGPDDNFGYGLINARKAVLAAQGVAPPAAPALVATPRSLNFSAADNSLDLILSNSGGGTLQVAAATPSVTWMTVTPNVVDTNGVGRYTVRVTRVGMGDGAYPAQIDIASNAGALHVPIVVQVLSGAAAHSNAGYHYVLMSKADTGAVVYQVRVTNNNGVYDYRFDDVAPGTYQIFAGTDSNNNFDICDTGEACGTYLTTDQPTNITVDRNLTSVNFFTGFDVAIRSQSASVGPQPGDGRLTLRRLQLTNTTH